MPDGAGNQQLPLSSTLAASQSPEGANGMRPRLERCWLVRKLVGPLEQRWGPGSMALPGGPLSQDNFKSSSKAPSPRRVCIGVPSADRNGFLSPRSPN
jgi:hypothetical protein